MKDAMAIWRLKLRNSKIFIVEAFLLPMNQLTFPQRAFEFDGKFTLVLNVKKISQHR